MVNQSQGAVALQNRLANVERLLQSDPEAADAAAAEILQEYPGNPLAGLFQGIARRLIGDAAGAVQALQPVCRNVPEAPLPHLQLGIALRELHDMAGAIRAVRSAVEAKADFSDGWYVLADLLIESGDRQRAGQAFAKYVEHSGQDPELREAADLLRGERLDEAERLLRRRVERNAVDIVALCMLAEIAIRYGNLAGAFDLLSDCLELAPGFGRARHNRAIVLLQQNRGKEALEESNRLLEDKLDDPAVRKLRAAILVRLLDYDEAIRIYQDLLDRDQNQPEVWTSIGHILKSVGRVDEGIAAYRKAIELQPSYGEPYWGLASLKTHRFTDSELDAMRAQLRSSGLRDEDRIHLHFAAGKALEDLQDYSEAFGNYAEGNRLRLAGNPYPHNEFADLVRRTRRFFTREFFARCEGFGTIADDPIFVVGLPRSGSTLVEQILASHSAVEGTKELPDIEATARSLEQARQEPDASRYPEILGEAGPEHLRELGEQYIERTRVYRKLGTPHFVDKMPNNFAHIGLIHLILPNARIVDVRRHPMACGFSLFKEHFAQAQNFSYSLESIGSYYRSYVELMAHWDQVLPGRVHRVIYESLVEDPESEIRRLLQYCGLSFEDNCVDYHTTKRAISTASSEQVRGPINRKGLDQWRHFESWLGPLKAELGPLPETYSKVE